MEQTVSRRDVQKERSKRVPLKMSIGALQLRVLASRFGSGSPEDLVKSAIEEAINLELAKKSKNNLTS